MKRLHIGVAGCGLFSESHLGALRAIPEAEVIAVYDPNQERATAMASAFGISQVCPTLESLCAVEVDAIDVVAAEGAHRVPVVTALEHGKHVFVEKPFATDLADCTAMIAAAQRAGRVLMVGHILRFEAKYALLKQESASGRLGRIFSMHARRNRAKTLLEPYGRTHPMLVNGIHDIDLMLWFTEDRVVRVRGYGRRAAGGRHDDVCWGVLEFERGAIGFVESIWLVPKEAGITLDDAFELIGDRGCAKASFFPGGLSFWRESGFEVPDTSYAPCVRSAVGGALRDELAYFCDCARRNAPPEAITPREAKNAVRIALAIIESAAAGHDMPIQDWD